MDEARAVLEGLRSIEQLTGGGAPAAAVLREVEALLPVVERWLDTEPAARERLLPALERCSRALARGAPPEVVPV